MIQPLRDARDHALRAIDCASTLDGGLSRDRPALEATLFNIAVIGEAISFVPDEVRTLAPKVSWAEARGMRNCVVHEYWRLDVETVCDTACRDLPVLAEQLKLLIERLASRDAGLDN